MEKVDSGCCLTDRKPLSSIFAKASPPSGSGFAVSGTEGGSGPSQRAAGGIADGAPPDRASSDRTRGSYAWQPMNIVLTRKAVKTRNRMGSPSGSWPAKRANRTAQREVNENWEGAYTHRPDNL